MSTTVAQIPDSLNIKYYRNDSFTRVFTFTDGNNDPLNLSTATVKMQIRKRPGEDALITITEDDGLTVISNTVVFDKRIDLAKGSYKYDIQFTYDSGVVRTYVSGQFIVIDDITR